MSHVPVLEYIALIAALLPALSSIPCFNKSALYLSNASLFNSRGKLVWERRIFEYEYIFKSNFLSSGIYNLILTGNDFFSSKKIVKK